MKPKTLLTIRATSALAIILFTSHTARALDYWFDQNGTDPGFGLGDAETHDWLGSGLWNASNLGTGSVITWPGGNNAAYFTGAGADTSYTVRLGPLGDTNTVLQNLFLNSNGAVPAAANGAGDVVIGNPGDTGELQLAAANSIGTAAGTLTINNPYHLGSDRNTSFHGGTITLNGPVSGTGTSGVLLESGGGFIGSLATGTLTLAHGDNTYTGITSIGSGYTLSAAKLANGGASSSIGASTNVAANLVIGGGTLRYTGPTASTNRAFTLTDATTGTVNVASADAILTISGASANTTGGMAKSGPGVLSLTGTNSYTGPTSVDAGTLSINSTDSLPGWDIQDRYSVAGGATLAVGNSITDSAIETLLETGNFLAGASLGFNTGTARTYGENLTDTANGPLGLHKLGPNVLTLTGTNTHTGPVTLTAGTLGVANTAGLGSGNEVIFNGGILRITGTSMSTYASGAISGHPVTLVPGKTVIIDISDPTHTFTIDEVLSQTTGGFQKFGTGTIVLNAANTYSGNTSIGNINQSQGGTLRITTPAALGTGSVTIPNSGVTTGTLELALTGTNSINNIITGFSSANSQFSGNPGRAQLLNTSGDNTINSNLTITAAGGSGVNVRCDGGTLTLAGSFRNTVANSSRVLALGGAANGFVTGLIRNNSTTSTSQIQKGGAGTWTLTHLNTYTGLTTLYGGILSTGADGTLANGGSPSSIGQSANVPANLIFDGGTLQYASTGPATSTDRLFTLTNNGGVLDASGFNTITFAGNGAGAGNAIAFSGSGPRTLTLTGINTGPNILAPVIGDGEAGPTSLVKSGPGTWSITGNNTYSGDTTVSNGVLALDGSSIPDTGKLVIDGGRVHIDATEVVDTLFFGTVQQAAGTWGSSDTNAENIDDSHFSGTGTVSVISDPLPTGFASWIAGFDLSIEDRDPTDDPDNDGLNNLLEYILGGNPDLNDAVSITPSGTQSGSNYIFTFERSDRSESDTTLFVEYGNDLVVWGNFSIGASPGEGPVVIQEDTPDPEFDTVTVTIPTGGAPKFFARLKAQK